MGSMAVVEVMSVVMGSIPSLDSGMRLQPPPFPPGLGVVVPEALVWGHCGPLPGHSYPASQFRVSLSESGCSDHLDRSRNRPLYRALTLTLRPPPPHADMFLLSLGPHLEGLTSWIDSVLTTVRGLRSS